MAVSYDDLERLLLQLGFAQGPMDGVHQTYLHPSGLTFSLPMMTRPARALPTYRTALRGYLHWAGLLDADQFDARTGPGPALPQRRTRGRKQAAIG